MMNRKGSASEGIFAFTFLFLIIIMTLGIVSTVYLFYGDGYDSREEEGFILNAKIIKCLNINGVEKFKMDFFGNCGINKKVFDDSKMAFKICKNSNFDDCIAGKEEFYSYGSNINLCGLVGAKKNKNYPRCATSYFNFKGEGYIVIASNNRKVQKVGT